LFRPLSKHIHLSACVCSRRRRKRRREGKEKGRKKEVKERVENGDEAGIAFQDVEMGNVSHKGRDGGLTKFQNRKLKYDFHTFFGKFGEQEGCCNTYVIHSPTQRERERERERERQREREAR
jgi:hypothetical protein